MKALVLEAYGRMAVCERPTPSAAAGEVLIRVRATGICGSDLHGFTGATGRRHVGQVMGHETVGTVAAIGAGAESAPALGTLVTINPVVPCGHCAACVAGNDQRCAQKYVIGVAATVSAAFAEFVVAPAANVIALPDLLDRDLGALVEPLAVGWHAVGRSGAVAGDRMLVVGGGPIGQAVALAARRLGADVLVSEPSALRREICARIGLPTADPGKASTAELVADHFGRPADVAVDAVGTSASVADALTSSAFGATVVLVGMGSPRLDLSAFAISTEERSVVGAFSYNAQEFREAAKWVNTNPPELADLIGERIPLAAAPDMFTELAASTSLAGKVLVNF